MRLFPLLSLCLLAVPVQAELRGIPVSELKRISPTETPGTQLEMPAAVPYGSIRMPALPPKTESEALPGRTVKTPQAPSATVPPAPTPTAVSVTVSVSATVTPAEPARPVIDAESCRGALRLMGELSLMAYQQTGGSMKSYMHMVAAVSLADDAVRGGGIPNLQAVRSAHSDMPWIGPLRREIEQANTAVTMACTPVGGMPRPQAGAKMPIQAPR